jgi:hypothetical protein
MVVVKVVLLLAVNVQLALGVNLLTAATLVRKIT